MRMLPVLLSVGLHMAVIALGVLYDPAPNLHVDLRKRTYTVDLVKLQAPAGKKVTKPAPATPNVAPAPKPKPAAKPSPPPAAPEPAAPVAVLKPKPKKIVKTAKKIPKSSPVKKISPKKRPETKRKKPIPAKPERKAPPKAKTPPKPKPPVRKPPKKQTDAEIMAAAFGDAQKEVSSSTKSKKTSAKDVLAREFASLEKSVGGTPGPGGGGAGGVVEEIFGGLVEEQVREHWRFPRFGSLGLAAVVEIVVDPSGQVVSKRVVTSSGRADFDASCLRAVEEAGSLPEPPGGKRGTVRITFNQDEQG